MTGNARIQVHHVGHEKLPVLVIDDALSGSEQLIDLAATSRWDVQSPYYPGIRAAAPMDYANALANALVAPIQNVFGLKDAALKAIEASFSLVTTPPDKLKPIQCAPHFDGTDPNIFAVLHFLSPADGSGTAFFRHLQTGYESVDASRYTAYRDQTDREIEEQGLPATGYVRDSSDRYEQTALFEAQPNRILIYQGHTLHSGYIPDKFLFSDDPRRGRLTVNTFLQYHP